MKKQILTGADSFEKIIEGGYFYIDKTMFIKELLENRGEVTLITRPRRFGKTMNMNMLKSFFDIEKDGKTLFDGLKIMDHGDIVEKHLNKYPVIFLTLKDVGSNNYGGSVEKIGDLVSEIYEKNLYIYESGKLNERQKSIFYSLFMRKATELDLQSSLKFLTSCLHIYYDKRVIVLLDEYDAPLTNALMEGYYNEMVKFMRRFMGSVFKSNDYLEFGLLTGVQRIAKEGLVSGFNNPLVCGIMDKEFTDCFGFTEDEVKDACEAYGLGGTYDEVKKWYDGYRFGGRDMYNPWSITGYLRAKEFGEYWVNTGSVAMFRDIYYNGDISLKNDVAGLITGAPVAMSIHDGITYAIEYTNSNAFWTLMLNAGYIKPCNGAKGDVFNAELVNMEVRNLFSRYAKEWFRDRKQPISEDIRIFVDCLLRGDAEGVGAALNDKLLNSPSWHDYKDENSYHMFIFGMLLALSGEYAVYSNPESGKGRSDCMIKPNDKGKYAVVIEFKHEGEDMKDLKLEAQKGLEQVDKKDYIHNLTREGYKNIYKYGIAFHKKTCEVAMQVD